MSLHQSTHCPISSDKENNCKISNQDYAQIYKQYRQGLQIDSSKPKIDSKLSTKPLKESTNTVNNTLSLKYADAKSKHPYHLQNPSENTDNNKNYLQKYNLSKNQETLLEKSTQQQQQINLYQQQQGIKYKKSVSIQNQELKEKENEDNKQQEKIEEREQEENCEENQKTLENLKYQKMVEEYKAKLLRLQEQNLEEQEKIRLMQTNKEYVYNYHFGDQNEEVSKQEYQDKDQQNVIESYANEILGHILVQEETTTPYEFLERHTIPIKLRAKMIDWMIEVLSSYKCKEETFFMSVRIMDKYFQQKKGQLELEQLHLIGVTSMFIACKYEEIYPMKLSVVYDKIGHKKLPIESIKEMEADILSALNFDLIGTSVYELTLQTLLKIGIKNIFEEKVYTYLERICTYLSKMVLYDYKLIKDKSYALLAGSLIFVSFKIIQQIEPKFMSEQAIKYILHFLNLESEQLFETSMVILQLARNFEKSYPQLTNLKKFNGFYFNQDGNGDDQEQQLKQDNLSKI